ncbi:MAG: response regulator [Blastocatellia bacterium]|nr:response regulator [Blastocatellia bacterium]
MPEPPTLLPLDGQTVQFTGTILIVDDSRINRFVLSKLLTGDGHVVVPAEHGRQALAVAASQPFDIILLDIVMPEMDGYEVLAALKADPNLRHVPVIMISGLEEMTSVIRCIEMGAEDYLLKPFNAMLLKARISACLEKKRLHDELVRQRDFIEEKNKQILDSIRYAERIQQAILPHRTFLDTVLNDYLLIYRPKDIVSGDFYWMYLVKNELSMTVFVAVADCTGHGVPGAFMSMIGSTLLNQIVGEKKIYDPALILEHLHDGVQSALGQNTNTSSAQDGMDVCLCRFDETTITFAGARRPLLLIETKGRKKQELVEIKGSRKTVGGKQRDESRMFHNVEIPYDESVQVFLTTDGFSDQSNPDSERLGSRRLKELLWETSGLPMYEQKRILLENLQTFQGKEPQRDDITVFGIQLPLSVATDSTTSGSFSMLWNLKL